jgi:hypothetical protein
MPGRGAQLIANYDTQYRAKSKHARKFAREVNRIHNNGARKPSVVFNAVARAISYKGQRVW